MTSMYIKRFKSGRISHYLKPIKIITGRYAVATSNLHPDTFICNINYPLFNSLDEAEAYLSERFEKIN